MYEKDQIKNIKIQELNPHEETIDKKLKKVLKSLKTEKVLRNPIVVDKNTKVILDGHHRAKALTILGLTTIPCYLVDYQSKEVELKPRNELKISKKDVIEKGLSNDLYPPKTSNHTIKKPKNSDKTPIPL